MSKRITKAKAEQVADALVQKKKEKQQAVYDQMSDLIKETCLKEIPKEVQQLFKVVPDHFKSYQHIRVYGEGISIYHQQKLNDSLPVLNGKVRLDSDQSDEFMKLHQRYNKMDKDIKKLWRDIKETVYGLRTYKRVKEDFPEAYKHLPNAKKPTKLMKNIDDIRAELNE